MGFVGEGPAGSGEDDDVDVGPAKAAKLVGLVEETLSSLAEGDLQTALVVDLLVGVLPPPLLLLLLLFAHIISLIRRFHR